MRLRALGHELWFFFFFFCGSGLWESFGGSGFLGFRASGLGFTAWGLGFRAFRGSG